MPAPSAFSIRCAVLDLQPSRFGAATACPLAGVVGISSFALPSPMAKAKLKNFLHFSANFQHFQTTYWQPEFLFRPPVNGSFDAWRKSFHADGMGLSLPLVLTSPTGVLFCGRCPIMPTFPATSGRFLCIVRTGLLGSVSAASAVFPASSSHLFLSFRALTGWPESGGS
ncbi:UNVERIFIED_CONTAM: hypothetical protein Slati_4074100 [Sesamum latifolium]|uniref:Uncharacterized protein n=1 Tax=Sesamum latifolium TaxID=2727402 RepID=A0AAW2T754_9LAMI